ncbi:MAG: succinylglutamate desuccinylase/aspartoacylase family protein [Phycisphaerales bacterium]
MLREAARDAGADSGAEAAEAEAKREGVVDDGGSGAVSSAGGGALEVAGTAVALGESVDVSLPIAQSYSGADVGVPVRVVRAPEPGPTVFVTGVVHGDELNGAGIVREIMLRPGFELLRGSLLLVPVVNILGFERHSRYLPDRRDLNRSFPGGPSGSLASRLAHAVFTEVIARSDFGIDLHTAALRRTNFPNVRGDLRVPGVRRIAEAFGCEIIINSRGQPKTLRRSACDAGVPTIILEAGTVWRVEPSVLEWGVRGIRNALIELGMVAGERAAPAFQAIVRRKTWVRARAGGFLEFHVGPGDLVDSGQPIATCTSLRGERLDVLEAPMAGVVLGMTMLPAATPGDPVCHLGAPEGGLRRIRKALRGVDEDSLHARTQSALGAAIAVTAPQEADGGLGGPAEGGSTGRPA